MKRRNPRFQRSDIPYSDRLLMQKYDSIREHRDEAARNALHLACVALNDTEGLGLKRLSKFAQRLRELIQEFYSDPEVGQVHLEKRLRQLGFKIENGHMYVIENSATGELVNANKILPGNIANPEVSGDA